MTESMNMFQQKENHNVELLTQIIAIFARIISCVADQSDHFNEIKKLVNSIYTTKNWSILRLDETTNQLFFTVIESDIDYALKQIPIKVGDGICGQVALSGKTQIINARDEKPAFTQSVDETTHFNTQTIIAVPIKHHNKVVGVLELINIENHQEFVANPHQMNLLHRIADLIGVIFSLSSIHQEIIVSSERDTLTGVFNRYYLNKVLKKKSGDANDDLLLVMIDLNNFKAVNDQYGHLAGDKVLRESARLLATNFRQDDIIIRYGGDEFLLLLEPEHTEQLGQLVLIVEDKLNMISNFLPYSCTFSYGMSGGKKKDFTQLFKQADERMYQNKRQGKKA